MAMQRQRTAIRSSSPASSSLGLAQADAGLAACTIGAASSTAKLFVGGFLLVLFETSIAKMRVFRVPDFLGVALMLGLLGTLLLFVSRSF